MSSTEYSTNTLEAAVRLISRFTELAERDLVTAEDLDDAEHVIRCLSLDPKSDWQTILGLPEPYKSEKLVSNFRTKAKTLFRRESDVRSGNIKVPNGTMSSSWFERARVKEDVRFQYEDDFFVLKHKDGSKARVRMTELGQSGRYLAANAAGEETDISEFVCVTDWIRRGGVWRLVSAEEADGAGLMMNIRYLPRGVMVISWEDESVRV